MTVADRLVDGLLVLIDDDADPADATVLADVMDLAPWTVRPSLPTRDLVDRVRDEPGPSFVVVTTAAGALVGVVERDALLALVRADRLP